MAEERSLPDSEKEKPSFLDKSTDEELVRMMRAFFKTMIESNTEKRGAQRTDSRDDNHRVRLEEKYLRRIE
eukprot:1377084-Karenia_brevis.AAC.1